MNVHYFFERLLLLPLLYEKSNPSCRVKFFLDDQIDEVAGTVLAHLSQSGALNPGSNAGANEPESKKAKSLADDSEYDDGSCPGPAPAEPITLPFSVGLKATKEGGGSSRLARQC